MTPPPDPKNPGAGPRPRQPSRPGIVTPDQPEREAVRHSGVDGSAQALPPHRKPTLNGLGAVRPSGEYAPTLPVPRDPPLKKTWRLPTPPSAVAKARRTDPPPSAESTTPGPASQAPPSAAEGQAAVLLEELTKERAKTAELERQARVRDEAELPAGSFPPPKVERSPAPPSPVSIPPDGSIASLRKAQTKLLLGIGAALAALATPLAIWVTNVAGEAKARSERASTQVAQATNAADDAKTKAGSNAKEAAEWERTFRKYRANRRELDRLQGTEYPKADGDPEPDDLKPYVPLCPAGKVCPGAQIILTRPL